MSEYNNYDDRNFYARCFDLFTRILTTTTTTTTTSAPVASNITEEVLQLTLRQDWFHGGRLIFVVVCSAYGTFVNIMFVSSFSIEHMLYRLNNTFQLSAGISDMVITGIVSPLVVIMFLSKNRIWNNQDNLILCQFTQIIGQIATTTYIIYFTFASAKNFYRICLPRSKFNTFFRTHVEYVSTLIVAGCTLFGFVGSFYRLDVDYCDRKHNGNFSWRVATTVVLQIMPIILTISFQLPVFSEIKLRAKKNIQYRRSQIYEHDYSSALVNLIVWVMYILLWTPYFILAYQFPNADNDTFYILLVLGLFRSVITSSVYGIFHVSFRKAFVHLFKYCFFKVALNEKPVIRNRRHLRQQNEMAMVKMDLTRRVIDRSPRRLSRIDEEVYNL